MSDSVWEVPEARTFTFDDEIAALNVRIVNGTVNVVGSDDLANGGGGARLEVSAVEGAPLVVTREGGTLTVGYEDVPWNGFLHWFDRAAGKRPAAGSEDAPWGGFLKWFDRRNWRRTAVVSLTVPASAVVEVGVVGAEAVVSGMRGRTDVRGVSGDTTLVGLSGSVVAETVTGNLEAQAVTGSLRFHSVSGDLTVVEGAAASVRADSVSGSMIVDLDPTDHPTDVRLTTVSGEVAIRLPHPADAEVVADTTSGCVSNAFDDLRVSGQWGAKKITGTLGSGAGSLRATTVSGSIALLRRPASDDGPRDAPVREKEL